MSRRFVNTLEFSPVAREGHPPPDSTYYESFWKENYNYIMNGYQVGGERITGDLYWFLNFWKIRGVDHKTKRKGIVYPRFLEMQYDYSNAFEEARNSGKNMCLLKRRQIGATEFHAAIGGKEFTFFPGSQTVYVSGLDEYTKKLMNDTLRGLNDLNDTEYYKNRFPDQSDYVRAAYRITVTDKDGLKTKVTKGFLSEIYSYTAKGNPQIVSSKSPSLIIFEEFGIFPNGIATYRFVEPSLYAEGIKTGMAVFTGTGGETDSALSGVGQLEEVFYNPDKFDCLSFDLSEYDDEIQPGTSRCCYFIPDWRFYRIDSDGNDLKQEAIEALDQIREEKEANDTFHEQCVTMPRKPAEAFMLPTGGYFGKQVASLLNKRRAKVMTHRSMQTKEVGRLEWVKDGEDIIGIEFIEDPEGAVEILEHPAAIDGEGKLIITEAGYHMPNPEGQIPDQLYFTGTDSYDKDEAKTSVSKGACVVRKAFHSISDSHDFFCAKVYMREEKAYDFYENTAKLTYYYNSKNMIEWSNILIFDWYKRNNLEYLLAVRPDFLISQWIINSQVENKYGLDPSSKVHWLKMLKQTLKEQGEIDRMLDVDLMKAFINFRLDPKYNCDLTIAASLSVVQINELNIVSDSLEMVDSLQPTQTKPWFGYRKTGGNIKFYQNN